MLEHQELFVELDGQLSGWRNDHGSEPITLFDHFEQRHDESK